ncbi:hypothetical protein MKK88_15640 [Methylobacterium sp. E-005]|uniref:hypothetical protein n=1 Tax=Methylobacterium sp. E-005 TaxID=2836549 RepID=UPI001FBBEB1D|nr:hypothetical protein [Methylobacterium sp. E-005]MCJ2087405.1 hypothetical protein [Methylobacterium sp. E-005]
MNQHDFPDIERGSPVSLSPLPDTVAELIAALMFCSSSLNQMADELASCANDVTDPLEQQNLWAAVRSQRIRELEVQGMLAALHAAFTDLYAADKQP